MKTIGIIAEYNPFHKGHLYQIQKLRSDTQADFVIAAMSGDFVQRGKPAVYDKYTRTRMALDAGIDLVIELPVCFATGSAQDFASCGAALLDRLGVVDLLGFGSESGDCALLSKAAELLLHEPEGFAFRLQSLLKQGYSFPKARAAALASHPEVSAALSSPNNILGVEYIKALKKRNSPIKPVTIQRSGQEYHDTKAVDKDTLASASAIRNAIRRGDLSLVQSQTPSSEHTGHKPIPLFSDDLTGLLNSRLLQLFYEDGPDSFGRYADMAPELASRLKRSILEFASFSGRVMQLKTRGYTYTRISRALVHLLLGITAEQTACLKSLDYVCYARILGFRRQAGPLLRQMKKRSDLPLITKTADARRLLDPDRFSMLQTDFHASHLYQSVVFAKSGQTMPNEYTQSVIVL